MDIKKVGNQIAELRKIKKLTQSELGERLGVSFQAVSKWERGETLPDTAMLPDIANILEATIDFILLGGERMIEYNGKIKISDIIEGLRCFENIGNLLGKENIIYRSAIKGINDHMNTDVEEAFTNDYVFEAFLAETVIQKLNMGFYVDLTDVKNNFRYDHFEKIIIDFCVKHGIK